MKYLKLFESFDESKIHKICKKYHIINYTINNDGSIDVDENDENDENWGADENYENDENWGTGVSVDLWNKKLTQLPLKFGRIKGDFFCSVNKLTSLEGCPKEVNGDFYCNDNQLTSFEYAPKIIRGGFYCNRNNIKSFEYFPSFVEVDFDCDGNSIWWVWKLFRDTTKIELLNDFDIFRDEDTETPAIVMDRLNDFLLTIGKQKVKSVDKYKNI